MIYYIKKSQQIWHNMFPVQSFGFIFNLSPYSIPLVQCIFRFEVISVLKCKNCGFDMMKTKSSTPNIFFTQTQLAHLQPRPKVPNNRNITPDPWAKHQPPWSIFKLEGLDQVGTHRQFIVLITLWVWLLPPMQHLTFYMVWKLTATGSPMLMRHKCNNIAPPASLRGIVVSSAGTADDDAVY